jgi:ubiquinone/menaquinone biosynthesis C-methylase UbiE
MIFDYFSKDPNQRAKFIFNLIAPVYERVDHFLEKNYHHAFDILSHKIKPANKTVLDLGCGSGVWISRFLSANTKQLTGIDFSPGMLKVAKKKYPSISFEYGDAENLEHIENNSFDIVTASYVLHGVQKERRSKILTEMHRTAKDYVIIHDFYGRTPLFVRFLEFMEKSDYQHFKLHFEEEMNKHFKEVEVVPVRAGAALYIGKK